jgi:hypothetical protein
MTQKRSETNRKCSRNLDDKTGEKTNLSESTGFALGLEQGENVAFTDGALDVTDDGPIGRVVDELHAHLGALSLRARAAQDLGNLNNNCQNGHITRTIQPWRA